MTEKRNKVIYEGFNAQELFEYLEQFSKEERTEAKIFIRTAPEGVAFNVKTLDCVEESTYGFFGKSLSCLILNVDIFSPPDPEDIDEDEDEFDIDEIEE